MCTLSRFVVLAGCLCLAGVVVAAEEETEPQGPEHPADVAPTELERITVTGERRGAAAGDIPPENVLTRQEVRATGATGIDELLEVLAPQIGSLRGRDDEPAVLLLDGQRVTDFRELRDIPVDAIDRVEILPEAVSLTYGFPAHQRVVNVVLRRRYQSTAGLLGGAAASEGGYTSGVADATRVTIGNGSRSVLNLRADGNSGLTEDERDLQGQDPSRRARSLIGSRHGVRGTFTHGRRVAGVGVAGNLELHHQKERTLAGLEYHSGRAAVRNNTRDSLHAGMSLISRAFAWQWSVHGNADVSRERESTDRDLISTHDRAATRSISADLDVVAHGTLFRAPAGAVGMTMGLGLRTESVDADFRHDVVANPGSVHRTAGRAMASIDLPVSRRRTKVAALGDLLLNGNVRMEQISDAGTLKTLGAGFHWSPVPRLELAANWTQEDFAPSMQQIAGAIITAPGMRLFDFRTGAATLATLITGGRPDLQAERGRVLLLSANLRLSPDGRIRIRASYARSRLENPLFTPFGATPAIENAFPERFTRHEDGTLAAADVRPLNAARARRNALRIGFDLSLPTSSLPPAEPGDLRVERSTGNGASPPIRSLFSPTVGRRFTLSLTDTVTFVDEMTLREQVKLDYLRGDAVGPAGGRPRHEIEGRAGYHDNGIGGLLSARWRSRTTVALANAGRIHFSSHALLDLRLFVQLDQRPGLISRHPWMEGMSVRLEFSNLFNTRPRARDANGHTPSGLQGNLLEPIGRTIGIRLRKGGGGIGG